MGDKRRPGWYNDDSEGYSTKRYWDGEQWTNFTQGEHKDGRSKGTKKAADAAKSVSTGVFAVLMGLFGLIVNIAIWVLVISAVATYVFNLGGWKIGGIRVFDILQFTLFATVLLCFINYAVAKPVLALFSHASYKKITNECFSTEGVTDADERAWIESTKHFMRRYLNVSVTVVLTSTWVASLIAFLAHDPMVGSIGYPWAGLITMVIMFLGMRILGLLFAARPINKLKNEDLETFEYVETIFNNI